MRLWRGQQTWLGEAAVRHRVAAFAASILGSALLAPVAAQAQLDLQNLVPCAQEGGVCRMPHPTNVYYGIPGKTVGRPFPKGGAIACTNQNFGDPVPNQKKMCWYAPRIADRGRGGEERYRREGGEDYGYGRRDASEGRGRDYDTGARYRRERDSDNGAGSRERDRGYDRQPPSPSYGGYGERRQYRVDPDEE